MPRCDGSGRPAASGGGCGPSGIPRSSRKPQASCVVRRGGCAFGRSCARFGGCDRASSRGSRTAGSCCRGRAGPQRAMCAAFSRNSHSRTWLLVGKRRNSSISGRGTRLLLLSTCVVLRSSSVSSGLFGAARRACARQIRRAAEARTADRRTLARACWRSSTSRECRSRSMRPAAWRISRAFAIEDARAALEAARAGRSGTCDVSGCSSHAGQRRRRDASLEGSS